MKKILFKKIKNVKVKSSYIAKQIKQIYKMNNLDYISGIEF